MKRFLSLLLALTAVFTAACFTSGSVIAARKSVDFCEINKGGAAGFVDKLETGTLEVVEIDGRKALRYTPNPTGENGDKVVAFEGLSMAKYGADYGTYRYMSIEYKYVSSKPIDKKFSVQLCNSNKVFANGAKGVEAQTIVAGDWTTAYFDLTSVVDGKLATDKDTHPINHIHVRPLGKDTKASAVDARDVVYIGKITFSEENLMPGGTTTAAPTAPTTGSSAGGTVITNGKQVSGDVIHFNKGGAAGFVDKVEVGTLEVVTEDGRSALKYTLDNTGENKDKAIAFEVQGLAKLGADYSTFRYAAVEYKYISSNPYLGKFSIQLCNSNKVFAGGGGVVAGSDMKSGEWTTAYFDLTSKVDGKLVTDKDTHPINHIHIRPFSTMIPSKLTQGDVIYIGKVIFSETNLEPGGVTAPLPGGKTTGDTTETASPATTVTPTTLGGPNTSATPEVVSDSDIFVDYTRLNGGKITGFVDKKDCGTLEAVTVDGRPALKYTPNPNSPDASATVAFETSGISSKLPAPLNYEDFNFITVEYFYDSDAPSYKEPMAIYLANSNKVFDKVSVVKSEKNLEINKWAIASFNITDAKNGLKKDMETHLFNHIHLRAFNTSVKSLKATDVLYIGKIGFHKENPMPKSEYVVTYRKGISGVELLEPTEDLLDKEFVYKKGESFTLPECPWTVDGMVFKGWKVAGSVLQEGEVVLCEGDSDFSISAIWAQDKGDSNSIAYLYKELFSEVVDKKTNLKTEVASIDGIETLVANPVPTDETGGAMILDAYSLGKKTDIDLDVYKYLTVIYKYDGAAHPEGAIGRPAVNFTRNSGLFTAGPALTYVDTHTTTDGWSAALFEIPDLTSRYTNPDGIHKLVQFHIYPFGNKGASADFSADCTAYIQGVVFHKEKPVKSGFYLSYITGFEDGTFGVNKPMTRAQACTVVARLLAGTDENVSATTCTFTDVPENAWYYKYVAYCQEKGLLGSYSGTFSPNANITRAEFAELVFNMGIVNAGGEAKTFTDVAVNHPRYKVISAASAAGLINGYSDGTFLPDREITRAQVVSVINNAYGRYSDASKLGEYSHYFKDVNSDHWAFSAIIDAAVSHAATTEASDLKSSKWLYADTLIKGVTQADFDAGVAKLAEIEALTERRIAEIRATKTNVNVTGTKYYISADGNDANDGLTPESAKKTIDAVNRLYLKSGDGVFFRRGDTFRGSVNAIVGVTYSAYGEGAKPVLTRSPGNFTGADNWELTDTPNVYKLKTPILHDVGLIVFNEGEAWSEKRIKGRTDFKEGKLSDLDCDLAMWHDVAVPTGVEGYVYLRSDKGNPGERFSSIELAPRENIIKGKSNVLIDNLCFKYTGAHAVGTGEVKNFTVQNCEFGWIGGSWFRTDTLSRYGNAVEVYGACDGYVVDNCYIYQVYDAGVTHQLTESANQECIMKDIKYINNVIADTSYSVEYFINQPDEGVNHYMQNFEISGNIMTRSGFGFGHQRPDKVQAAHIKGWNSYNEAENYTITNNIFDRARYMMLQAGAFIPAWAPKTSGNTYIQYFGSDFGNIGNVFSNFDGGIIHAIRIAAGEQDAQIYFLPEYNGEFDK